MALKKYTHLFFDLDNTLWDFKRNSKHAMQETFTQFQLNKKGVEFDDFFEVYAKNNHKLWAAYRKKEIKKKELTSQRFQLTFETLQISGVDAQAMNDLYLTEMPKQDFLVEGARELLDYLKIKSYKLYLITNGFSEVQHKKLHSAGLAHYFQKVFISEEVKCPKPGRDIFEHAIKSANAKKANSLMIGDDWDSDILGASNFGIDAVYYTGRNHGSNLQSDVVGKANSTIRTIIELKELFSLL